jgi:hypothetical protein
MGNPRTSSSASELLVHIRLKREKERELERKRKDGREGERE